MGRNTRVVGGGGVGERTLKRIRRAAAAIITKSCGAFPSLWRMMS